MSVHNFTLSLNISSFRSEDEYILWITHCEFISQVPENNPVEQNDLNGRTLDLSLGLKAHEGDDEPGPEGDRVEDGHNQNEWLSPIIIEQDCCL